jgi:thiol:disulfide interchange protein DsbD
MFKSMYMLFFAILLSALIPVSAQQSATPSVLAALNQDNQFLPVEQAFVFDFRQNGNELELNWTIAEGYYLYKDKIKLAGIAVSFSHPAMPTGEPHEDEYFGKTEVYRKSLSIKIPLSDIDAKDAQLKVRFQGCADAGLCYPPVTQQIPLIPVKSVTEADDKSTASADAKLAQTAAPVVSSQLDLASRLGSDRSLLTLGLFFILGLGLAFTPCVFPMYPILTSIIVGQGNQLSTGQAFRLSMAYVQGMAITYSLLGLVVASAGVKFQAAFQHPAVLIAISLLFVVLALAMFGVFTLQLPSSWQEKVSNISNNQQGGSIKGALIMGVLSGLVASPCTTAPLTGVLLYIAQSGDMLYGALVLYILSLGMGLPLLVLGSSGGKILPRPGAWMDLVKAIFGFLLLSVPLVLLSRILSEDVLLVLSSLLVLVFAAFIQQSQQLFQKPLAKTLCWLIPTVMVSATVMVNYQHWYAPTPVTTPVASANESNAGEFIDINTLADLDNELKKAQAAEQFVMLDFFAQWCVACKEFEHKTFTDAAVKAEMAKMRLLRIDVTDATPEQQQVLDKFQVLGLPTLLFFSPNGNEMSQSRITGFQGPTEFKAHLTAVQSR